MSRPRVAYLVKRFPRLSESFVLNEILEIRRQGLDVTVYALMDPHEKLVSPEAEQLRPEVVYLHDSAHRPGSWRRLTAGAVAQVVRRPLGAARLAWALLSVHRSAPSLRHALEALWLAGDLRRRGVTHLHAHFAHSPAAVAYMAWLAGGPPYSFTAHAKDLYTTLPRNLRIRIMAARFVVTCTDFNRAHIERLLAQQAHPPVHVLYHGTDLSRFHPNGQKPVPGRILSVGRLVEKKGYTWLLDALAILRSRNIGFRCDIYGGGPMRASLDERIEALGLHDMVKLHGARLQAEIVDAYHTAAVFALAPVVTDNGDRDGIPNVLVEAMASQVPVVSTSISGIPELIASGSEGLLVEPGDPRALADALQAAIEDGARVARMAAAGRAKVERHFDLVANTARLRALLVGAK
jgi:glycosyltransferase involved in cell wall biosynthesis